MTEPVLSPRADPDLPCPHPDFESVVDVQRLGVGEPGNPNPLMPRNYLVEVQVKCAACGERFKFEGVPAGLSFASPATSVDGFELRAPIRPEQAPPAFPRRGDTVGFELRRVRRPR